MAIQVRERRSRKCGLKKNGQKTENTGTRVFRCILDDNAQGPATAETECVARYPTYSTIDRAMVIESVDTDEVDDSGRIFDVTIQYSDKIDLQTDQQQDELKVSFGFQSFEEEVFAAPKQPTCVVSDGRTQDISQTAPTTSDRWRWGNRICNSAGQAFDPSITKVYFDPTITIKRQEPDWDLQRQIKYQDAINSDNFTISYQGHSWTIKKGQALMTNISAEASFKNGQPTYDATYEIALRADGWGRKVADLGTAELNNGDFPLRPIRDKEGNPVTYPTMLDGAGAKSSGAKPPTYFLVWNLHAEQPFGNLRFG